MSAAALSCIDQATDADWAYARQKYIFGGEPSGEFEEYVFSPVRRDAGGSSMNPYTVSKYLRQEVIVPLAQVVISPEDIEDLGWQDRALCAQTDPDAFFPEKGGSTREAKRVCRSCEVRAECLEYALETDQRFGIWGGMSERERRRLKRQAA